MYLGFSSKPLIAIREIGAPVATFDTTKPSRRPTFPTLRILATTIAIFIALKEKLY